jgi:hypothetical protein
MSAPAFDPFDGAARRQVERLQGAVHAIGLKTGEVRETPFGAGFGVAWSDTRFSVVSAAFEETVVYVYVTAGVLKNVPQARQALLEVCNGLTRDNPLFPAFLHDAEAGWDVLLSARSPAEVLMTQPAYFRLLLEFTPGAAEQALERFAAEGIPTSERHTWSEDIPRLIMRSVM